MAKVDHNKIAKALGATRMGTVTARGGYFGALETLAEVRQRFPQPPGDTTMEKTTKQLVDEANQAFVTYQDVKG